MIDATDPHDAPAWPDLHINDAGRTIKASLEAWLTDNPRRQPGVLTVLAGYVSIRGLLALSPTLFSLVRIHGVRLRLLFGVAPGETAWVATRGGEDHRHREAVDEAALPKLLATADQLIRAEIDGVPATKRDSMALLELLHLLRHELVSVRRYERRFMHAKAVVFEPARGASTVLIGSANLSLGGYRQNQELQGELPPRTAAQAASLINHWWRDAVDYDLAALIERRFLAWPHELVYLRMLQEVYGDEVGAETQLKLHDYQKDGVAKALAVMQRLGGVLIGDDVGLGKTYQAAELIRCARDAGWGATLVVCPASLRRMWETKLATLGISADIVSYHQLRDAVAGHTADSQWAAYGMIICDEAHILRNPATSFMTAVRSLVRHQSQRPYVVLMTATPVNNLGRDLYELLALADPHLEPHWVPGQAHTIDRESTRSPHAKALLARCERPHLLDPSDLEQLHTELDRRMVRRTREFINDKYPAADLKFPKQIHEEVTYRLSDPMRRLLGDVLDALGVDDGQLPPHLREELCALRGEHPRFAPLTLAAYELSAYANGTDGLRPQALAGLLRILLCKRIESSPAAFAATATQLTHRTQQVLADLRNGVVRVPNQRARAQAARDLGIAIIAEDPDHDADTDPVDMDLLHDESEESAREGFVRVDLSALDVEQLTAHLTADYNTLTKLAARAREAARFDTKRERLLQLLSEVAHHRSGPKTVLFASARVTTTDIEDWLTSGDAATRIPAVYRSRIGSVGGPKRLTGREVAHMVARFAPKTAADLLAGGLSTPPPDTYDLLIGTDMLAEGFNLQQAGIIINYDLPWNPQILGQRAGRIDRLASLHEFAMCYTFKPDTGVDLILNLMDRLIHKADIAAAAVGLPNPLFAGSPVAPRTFATWTSDAAPNLTLGRSIADEHRATLANALRIDTVAAALRTMPAGSGTVVQAAAPGTGTVFCLDKHLLPPDWRHGPLGYILGGSRAGVTIRDPQLCLQAAQVPLSEWLLRARNGEDPVEKVQPLPDTSLATMLKRLPYLDQGRQPEERVQAVAWINFEENRRTR
jgi:hypothetical protein